MFSSTRSLLKILCVPILVAALHQTILFVVLDLQWGAESMDFMLSNGDAMRVAFVKQAALALILTALFGLPFFRFCARKNHVVYPTWLAAWAAVHGPTACLIYLHDDVDGSRLVQGASLIVSVIAIASLWWCLFYVDRSIPNDSN